MPDWKSEITSRCDDYDQLQPLRNTFVEFDLFPNLGYRFVIDKGVSTFSDHQRNIITKFDLLPLCSSWDLAHKVQSLFLHKSLYLSLQGQGQMSHLCLANPWYYTCRPPENNFNGYQSELLLPCGYRDMAWTKLKVHFYKILHSRSR